VCAFTEEEDRTWQISQRGNEQKIGRAVEHDSEDARKCASCRCSLFIQVGNLEKQRTLSRPDYEDEMYIL
jgi:hypothetical protein